MTSPLMFFSTDSPDECGAAKFLGRAARLRSISDGILLAASNRTGKRDSQSRNHNGNQGNGGARRAAS
jgi:hypothetical protein